MMAKSKLNRQGWLKRILIAGILLIMLGSVMVWYILNDKFKNTANIEAAYAVNALDFIKEFEKDDSLANLKYAEKIILVSGVISEVEPADTTVNVKMANPETGSYIIFAFQKEDQAEAKKVTPGDTVSIKGSCSGGVYSTILESEFITFKRCILNK